MMSGVLLVPNGRTPHPPATPYPWSSTPSAQRRIENPIMHTFAVLYLSTLMIAAITVIAIYGTVGALVAIPGAFIAAANFIRNLK